MQAARSVGQMEPSDQRCVHSQPGKGEEHAQVKAQNSLKERNDRLEKSETR